MLIKEIHELGIVIMSLPKALRIALRIKSKILNVPDKTLHNLAPVLGSCLISWNCPPSPCLHVPGLAPAISVPLAPLYMLRLVRGRARSPQPFFQTNSSLEGPASKSFAQERAPSFPRLDTRMIQAHTT